MHFEDGFDILNDVSTQVMRIKNFHDVLKDFQSIYGKFGASEIQRCIGGE
jgi:hypothetical protein